MMWRDWVFFFCPWCFFFFVFVFFLFLFVFCRAEACAVPLLLLLLLLLLLFLLLLLHSLLLLLLCSCCCSIAVDFAALLLLLLHCSFFCSFTAAFAAAFAADFGAALLLQGPKNKPSRTKNIFQDMSDQKKHPKDKKKTLRTAKKHFFLTKNTPQGLSKGHKKHPVGKNLGVVHLALAWEGWKACPFEQPVFSHACLTKGVSDGEITSNWRNEGDLMSPDTDNKFPVMIVCCLNS